MVDLAFLSPFWIWTAAALALLAVEVATGAELFLWPAVAAGVVAVLVGIGLDLALGWEVAIFAVLTIVGTLAARRIRRPPAGPDINAPMHRLVGLKGEAVVGFVRGQGRVRVEGAEWAAEIEPEDAGLDAGDRIEVAAVLDGGRLRVRPV